MGLLGKCRILVVENGSCDGSEAERTRLLNQMAAGKLKPTEIGDPEAMFRGFELLIGAAIYGTGKKIVLENSPWTEKDGQKFLTVFAPPQVSSLDQALRELRAALEEGGSLVRRRDEAYANQLSELTKQNSSTSILAMMGAGHERTVAKYLKVRGVVFREVKQPSSLPSTYRSVALEKAANEDGLSRGDLLRCLAEMLPLSSFLAQGFRGELMMFFWVQKRNEADLVEYLSSIYPN